MAKADIQKILLTGEDRPDLYSVHKLQADPETQKPQVKAEFHGVPINYPVDGGFEECDTTLLPEEVWEFEYVNRMNNFTSYFNDRTDPDNPTLASFEIINSQGVPRWINYKMYGITTPSIGVPDGNKIMYSDVFPNVDLEYIVDTWRLKENIIIKQPVEYYGYKFTLKLDENIVMEQQEDGSIDFIDSETGERLWGIEKPYAKDAENNRTDNVRYILGKEIYNEIEYDSVEVLIEDADFIANAIFPIVIDPTTTNYNVSAGADDGRLEAVKHGAWPPTISDASVRSVTESSFNIARIRYSGPQHWDYVGLMRFNTASIPDNAIVSSASLKLHMYRYYAGTRNVNVEYYSFSSITSSAYTSSVGTTAFSRAISGLAVHPGASYTNNLSNIGNINKTGYTGFRMGISGGGMTANGDSNGTGFTVCAFENSDVNKKPVLIVTYNVPPTTPTLLTPNGGEEYNESCSITWIASTDPEGDPITYHLQYSLNNGSDWYDITSGISGTTKYANKLGTDGDCEDLSRFILSGTPTLSTTQKKSGLYSIKCATSNQLAYIKKDYAIPLNPDKCYMFRMDVYEESYSFGGGVVLGVCPYGDVTVTAVYRAVSDVTKIGVWQTLVVKIPLNNTIPTSNGFLLYCGIGSLSTHVAYMDNIMLTEIAPDDYSLSDAELLAKYPYVNTSVLGHTWDTSEIPPSENCLVRIRAYDGYGYSAYDQSDAVFTIKHITDQVNIGGELKEVDKRYVNIEGVLKEIDWIKVNVGGVLKDT